MENVKAVECVISSQHSMSYVPALLLQVDLQQV